MPEPNPWILAAFATNGMEHAVADLFNTTNNTSTSNISATGFQEKPDNDSTMDNVLLAIRAFLPIVTLCLGFVGCYLLDYGLDNVIFTIATIEAPVAGGVDSETLGSEKRGLLDDDERTKRPVMKNAEPHYVTNSIRATIRHLNAEAGDLSFFRGIGAESAVRILSIPLVLAIEFLVRRYVTKHNTLGPAISSTLCYLILTQAVAACTHMVISKPRHKFWFRRLPLSWFRVVYLTAASIVAYAVTEESINWIFKKLMSQFKEPKTELHTDHGDLVRLSSGPVIPISFLALFFMLTKALLKSQLKPVVKLFFEAPLTAIHTRIEASMLPDIDDPIVPMDRQFAGRPQTGIVTPTTPLNFISAAKTIDKATFIRLLKLDLKLHFVKQILTWAFWTLVFSEVVWLVGPATTTIVVKMVLGTEITQGEFDALEGSSRSIVGKMIYTPKSNVTASAPMEYPVRLSGGSSITMTAPS